MSGRVRKPLHSFILFLMVCGLAYLAWENRDFFENEPKQLLTRNQVEELRERVVYAFQEDACFLEVRGNLNWRPREQRYRMEIVVGNDCEMQARKLCEDIAHFVQQTYNVPATVFAFDDAGREVARAVL